jgi:hypothetical protein
MAPAHIEALMDSRYAAAQTKSWGDTVAWGLVWAIKLSFLKDRNVIVWLTSPTMKAVRSRHW